MTNKEEKALDLQAEVIVQRMSEIVSKKLDMMAIPKRLYTAEEAAWALGISLVFLRQLVRQKQIYPIVKLGRRGMRIPINAIEDFVNRGGVSETHSA